MCHPAVIWFPFPWEGLGLGGFTDWEQCSRIFASSPRAARAVGLRWRAGTELGLWQEKVSDDFKPWRWSVHMLCELGLSLYSLFIPLIVCWRGWKLWCHQQLEGACSAPLLGAVESCGEKAGETSPRVASKQAAEPGNCWNRDREGHLQRLVPVFPLIITPSMLNF